MSGIVFAVPGDLDLPTGGYRYDRRLLAEWAKAGVAARHLVLPGSFPDPTPEDLAQTGRLLRAQAPGSALLIDGLAYGAFPESLAAGLGPASINRIDPGACSCALLFGAAVGVLEKAPQAA